MSNKSAVTSLFLLISVLAILISSCGKEKEPANNGLFTIEPVVEEEEEEQEPSTPYKSWTMRINNILTEVDTSLITYAYEDERHVFRCITSGADMFTIRLMSLDSALYTIDLDYNTIEYKQNGIVFNGANSPQGVIHLYRNSDNSISANFTARLFNLSAGQERMITDGKMRNIPYTP
jgi:hypothetical protein